MFEPLTAEERREFEADVSLGLPTLAWPSDHLPIGAVFEAAFVLVVLLLLCIIVCDHSVVSLPLKIEFFRLRCLT